MVKILLFVSCLLGATALTQAQPLVQATSTPKYKLIASKTAIKRTGAFINTVNRFANTANIATELCTALHFKFAQLLDTDVESITNEPLFAFIEDWWGTRYRYGGTTKRGVDCSAYMGHIFENIYGFKLPRTARMQYAASVKVNYHDLQEGDLVFFNTRGGVSHVGMYLANGYFTHSSSSKGVTINNLSETYYNARFIGGGRIVEPVGEAVEETDIQAPEQIEEEQEQPI
jgi:cell wall-associated NlpC family hydrolase